MANRFRLLQDGQILDAQVGKKFKLDTPNNRAFVNALEGPDGDFLRRELDRQERGVWLNPDVKHRRAPRQPVIRRGGAQPPAPKVERMAGDSEIMGDLDKLLNVIQNNEIGEIQANRRQLLADNKEDIDFYKAIKAKEDSIEQSFVRAGLTPEQAKRVQYDTDKIVEGEVPAAYVPNEGAKSGSMFKGNGQVYNGETRYHTEYEINPLTGQQDIVPFISEGVPLVTQFGRTGKVDGVATDEFLVQRLRQLMRQDVENNNVGTRNQHRVDFIDKATGRKVDAELTTTDKLERNNDRIGVQAYTSLATPDTVRTSPRDIGNAVSNEILNEVSAYDVTLEQAVDDLYQAGRLVNGPGTNRPRKGKAFIYDEVVYPVTTSRIAKANIDNHDITFPLEGAYQVDMSGTKGVLDGLTGSELRDSLTFPTYSGHKTAVDPYPVAKAYVQVPTSHQSVRNLAETNPIVRQLFTKQ